MKIAPVFISVKVGIPSIYIFSNPRGGHNLWVLITKYYLIGTDSPDAGRIKII